MWATCKTEIETTQTAMSNFVWLWNPILSPNQTLQFLLSTCNAIIGIRCTQHVKNHKCNVQTIDILLLNRSMSAVHRPLTYGAIIRFHEVTVDLYYLPVRFPGGLFILNQFESVAAHLIQQIWLSQLLSTVWPSKII